MPETTNIQIEQTKSTALDRNIEEEHMLNKDVVKQWEEVKRLNKSTKGIISTEAPTITINRHCMLAEE